MKLLFLALITVTFLGCTDSVSGEQQSSSENISSELSSSGDSSEREHSSVSRSSNSSESISQEVSSSSNSVESVSISESSSSLGDHSSSERISSQATESSSALFNQEKWDTLHKDTEYIFDHSSVKSYEVLLDEDSLAFLDAEPAREIYVEGKFVFQGDTIGPVGIRYKGAYGGFEGCKEGSIFEQEGKKLDNGKCSVKIKFNWGETYEKFYGLKKLQLHAANSDKSKMHDRLGYHLYKEFGVTTARSTHAHLSINGEYSGLFEVVEQIDGRFTAYNYPEDGDGNLYKKTWPLTQENTVVSIDSLLKWLKTNEEVSDVSDMLEMGQAIVDASDDDALRSEMEQWFDVDEMLRYIVVDRAIANDDGMYKWYCKEGGVLCHNHNFYLYQEEISKRVHVVPWDLDGVFQNVNLDNIHNIWTWIQDDWNETRNECEVFEGAGQAKEVLQISGACNKVLAGFTLFEDEHDVLKKEFYRDYLNPAYINATLDEWSAIIDEAVKKDAEEFYKDPSKYNSWISAVEELKADIEASIPQRGL